MNAHRLEVTYALATSDVRAVADAIRVEQTIEFPADLAPPWIQDEVVGEIVSEDATHVTISYDERVIGGDLVQLLNVLWGNVSLFSGVRIIDVRFPESVLAGLTGPRFGVAGVRQLLRQPHRPLVCTALKPMGMSPDELAADAAILAEAGFDLIKDDHGLANQPWAPWRDRVARCSEAVNSAAERAGTQSFYLPTLNVPAERIVEAAHEAKALGAGGLLVLPGISGFDTMRSLASDESLGLPIMAHPSMLGSHVVNPGQGINHGILLGTLMRMAGADLSIFPNHGGRFAFSVAECADIRDRCAEPLGSLAPVLPSPGGGMSLDRIPGMIDFYGRDVTLLIGGALHRGDLSENARAMMEAITSEA